jgi:glutamate:GABA antiporter
MGFRDLLLFYVVSGISLRWIATAAAGGPSSVVIWIAAWFTFYTPLALSVIELSSRYPNEGGLYVWNKRAFGDFAGFMSAWSYWTCNLPYFPAVLYFAFSNLLYVRHDRWIYLSGRASFFIGFSLLALASVTALNVLELDIGRWLHNLGALAMWTPVLIVVTVGVVCWHRFGSATSFTLATMTPSLRLQDIIFWSTLAFAMSGCEMASFMCEEIKNPRRAIPRALFVAGITVTLSYTLGTVAVLLVLPANQVNNLQGLMQAIFYGAQRTGLSALIPLAAGLLVLSNLGAAGASLAGVARLPFVAGLDHFLPRSERSTVAGAHLGSHCLLSSSSAPSSCSSARPEPASRAHTTCSSA